MDALRFVGRAKDAFASPAARPRPTTEIAVVRLGDDRYPPLLRQIHDPPKTLYIRGLISALSAPHPLAVVGTRKMTAYGSTAIKMVVAPAAAQGVAIVSGLALGIDAAAHSAALDVGGITVAVLAGGVDPRSVGPRTNAALAERIVAAGGALVSEYPPGTQPSKFGFPRRNRIVAGLTRGTLVVEAAAKSGSLITAYSALDINRDVFAVPGPITSAASSGANGLLRRGAIPVTEAAHLLEYFGITPAARSTESLTDATQRAVIEALLDRPMSADDLARETSLPVRDILAAATILAVAGVLTEDHGLFIKN